jgi:hypothetical protein
VLSRTRRAGRAVLSFAPHRRSVMSSEGHISATTVAFVSQTLLKLGGRPHLMRGFLLTRT